MLQNLLVLFGTTRRTFVKRLKAIATQKKQKLPRSLWLKPGGTVECWQNLLNGVFKDDGRKFFE